MNINVDKEHLMDSTCFFSRKSIKSIGAFLMGLSLFYGCSKEESGRVEEPVRFSVEEENLIVSLSDTVKIQALFSDGTSWEQQWKINGLVLSDADSVCFLPFATGTYLLEYEATQDARRVSKSFTLKVNPATASAQAGAYVQKLFAYRPAPGQFANQNPADMASAISLLGQKGLVSLGAWGGYAVYGFDHRVTNRQEMPDIIVYGNAQADFAEPGVVWVMRDENGNGEPDDTWYEIAGSETGKTGYQRNYEVTYSRPISVEDGVSWIDNMGQSGVINKNSFHEQSYFPDWEIGNSYTLTGTLLPITNINSSNSSYITSAPFAYGYADNLVGGNPIDLANAMDEQGNPVNLPSIDFIKIQTGIQAELGWAGELSTELLGIADLSLLEN